MTTPLRQRGVQVTFQPFAVQCVTCGSSLRVTDESLLGTIATCPKCQSMVQIETENVAASSEQPPGPPPAQLAVGTASVDSQAITEDAVISKEIDWSGDPSSASHSGFAGAVTAPPQPPATIENNQPLLSPQVQRSKQIALVATLSISGLLLAVAIFSWFVLRWQAASSVAQTELSIPVAQAGLDVARSEDEPGSAAVIPLEQNEVDAPDDAIKAPHAVKNKSGKPESQSTESIEQPLGEPPEQVPGDLVPQSPLDPSTPVVSATAPKDQPPFEIGAIPDRDSGSLTELPPELAKFTEFLLTDGSLDKATLPAPPSIDDVELDAASNAEEIDVGAIVPRTLNLAGDLGINMAVSSDGYPATDLLLLIGQLTTVPMEVDWISYDLLGTNLYNKITVPKGMRTARELIDSIAESLESEWREEKTLIVFSPTKQRFATLISEVSDLSDFANGQETAIATLMKLLEPGSNEQHVKLQIGEDRSEQQLAVLAIESLRLMRGLKPKIRPERWQRWASPQPAAEWSRLSAATPPPPTDTPISLATFLLACSRPNGATCLVNWHDLNRWGIGPESLLFPHTKVDAASTLTTALQRWNIEVRRVDQHHWWIGSEATYDRIPILLWTDPMGDRLDMSRQRIASIIDSNPHDQIRMVYDESSDRMLVRMPRYLALQLPKLLGR